MERRDDDAQILGASPRGFVDSEVLLHAHPTHRSLNDVKRQPLQTCEAHARLSDIHWLTGCRVLVLELLANRWLRVDAVQIDGHVSFLVRQRGEQQRLAVVGIEVSLQRNFVQPFPNSWSRPRPMEQRQASTHALPRDRHGGRRVIPRGTRLPKSLHCARLLPSSISRFACLLACLPGCSRGLLMRSRMAWAGSISALHAGVAQW